jgi:hypothetical protein
MRANYAELEGCSEVFAASRVVVPIGDSSSCSTMTKDAKENVETLWK